MKERYEEFDERLNKFSCDFYVNKNKKIGNSYVKQKCKFLHRFFHLLDNSFFL